MSKIYNKYCDLKKIDKDTMYLFKCGNFYIFIGEDAEKINNYVPLKLTTFCNEAKKCGFPLKCLDDYMRVFNNQNLKVKIIFDTDVTINENIINKLKNIDLDNITPIKALTILYEIKDKLL